MIKVLVRLAAGVTALSALYLVGANLALNLPVARERLNALAPQRFAVSWQQAWSWYPLHVELRGLAADGQTPNLQWQLDAPQAAASVSLPALLRGQVRVHDIRLRDPDLRVRPRPPAVSEAGPVYARQDALRAFYPVIRNRDPKAPAEPIPPGRAPLVLALDHCRVDGRLSLWIAQIRAGLSGHLGWSIGVDTGAETISIAGGQMDLKLDSLGIADEPDVAGAGWVRGQVDMPPVKLGGVVGLDLLKALSVDAEMDLPLHNLEILNRYHGAKADLRITGSGRVRGRLHLTKGDLRRDTSVSVTADQLGVRLGALHFDGDGTIELRDRPTDAGDMTIRFDAVEAFVHRDADGEARPLFRGRDLSLMIDLPEDVGAEATATDATQLILDVPTMQVPDLAGLDRLLPDKWGVRLLGGNGQLSGRASVSRKALDLDLHLRSNAADVALHDLRITTDLDLGLKASGSEQHGAALDLAGSYLKLDDARLRAAAEEFNNAPAEPWRAALEIADGRFSLQMRPAARSARAKTAGEPHARTWGRGSAQTAAGPPAPSVADGAMLYLARRLGRDGFGALLGDADGRLKARLAVSRLGWITRLLHSPLDLALSGAGELNLDLRLARGWPAKGTTLTALPKGLALRLLDHVATGDGRVALRVVGGGGRPDLDLTAGITGGLLKRRDEAQALVDRVDFEVSARARAGTGQAVVTQVDLRIPQARVRDLRGLNAYLPPYAGVAFTAGEANLTADLALKPDDAKGTMLLLAKGLRASAGDQAITGDLRVEIAVNGGQPRQMEFDINGSALVLERVQVAGATAGQRQDWHARLELEQAGVRWQKPITLDATAGVTLKDARPLVAVVDNLRGQHRWIHKLLDVDDIGGHMRLSVDGSRMLISDAMLGSQAINLGVKGLASAAGREGLIYARWQQLTGLVKVRGNERHFDIFDARAKFDAYVPGESGLILAAGGPASDPMRSNSTAGLLSVPIAGARPRVRPAIPAGPQEPGVRAEAVDAMQPQAVRDRSRPVSKGKLPVPSAAPDQALIESIPAFPDSGDFDPADASDAGGFVRLPPPASRARSRGAAEAAKRRDNARSSAAPPFLEGGP